MALELEQLDDDEPDEQLDSSKQRTYEMIREASQLLPLFQQHTEAEFAGSGPPAETGFRSLPNDVQHTILDLASDDQATARQLRSVCRTFAAHACLTERSRTSLDTGGSADEVCRLPYLPRLRSINCPEYLQETPLQRYVNSILTTHLAAWPALTSLKFKGDEYELHCVHFLCNLHLAPQLLQLTVDGLLPAAAEGVCPLHAIWRLTRLRALSLDIELLEGHPSTVQLLSQLQQLTRLHYTVHYTDRANDEGLQLALAESVGHLPCLQELVLDDWQCTEDPGNHAPWQALTQSVSMLTRLTLLHFGHWNLQPSTSAHYLPSLTDSLQVLCALSHLELHGPGVAALSDWVASSEASAAFTAGSALVAAVRTLRHLDTLVLSNLAAVNVCDCCKFLAPLVRLQHLVLKRLPARAPGTPDVVALADKLLYAVLSTAPPVAPADESTFLHLLSRVTRLQSLELSAVGLSGRDALRVFSTGIPALIELRMLDVRCNALAAAPLMVLAQSCRQLPNLRVMCGGCGGEMQIARVVEDLNCVAGRTVFFV